jgi:type IV secretory pathway VirB2 component (pilin)
MTHSESTNGYRRPKVARGLRLFAQHVSMSAIVVVISATDAFAQATGGTNPATILTNICNFILGPFGQSLAILGIIAIGLSWMFGRASLALIAGVVGGIVIMFGASYLGQTLLGG